MDDRQLCNLSLVLLLLEEFISVETGHDPDLDRMAEINEHLAEDRKRAAAVTRQETTLSMH